MKRIEGGISDKLILAAFLLLGGHCFAVESWWLPEYYVPDQLLYPQETRGFHLGPIDAFPRISTSLVYDDNVNISSLSTGQQSDLIWSLAPGASLVLGAGGEGKSLTLDYTPAFVFYVNHSQYDAIDHSANLHGTWPFSRLTLGFGQGIQVRSGGVAEVGSRADTRSYSTQLTSRYELGEKTSFEVNGSQNITDYSGGPFYSSQTWANDDWMNYQAFAKVTTGLGFSIGYLEADQNPNQLFERVSLRAGYALAAKVNVSASFGGEWRQYQGGVPGTLAPVFSLSGVYTPREGTSITVEGHRQDQNSAVLAGQDYISTGFTAGISQQLWEKYSFHINGGYDSLDYHATAQGVIATRQDQTYLVRVGVDTVFLRRVSVGLFYQYRDNISNDTTFRFANNQIGLVAGYTF